VSTQPSGEGTARVSSDRLRPATYDDRTEVCDRLAETFPATPRSEWAKLFEHRWRREQPDFGVVLERDGRIVGYLGAIHSHRVVNGQRLAVANMIGWWVDPKLRGDGLGRRIANAWMERYRDRTATMLTFRHDHMAFWSRYDIRPFDTDRTAWLLRPWWWLPRSASRVPDEMVSAELVGAEPFRIWADHRGLRCESTVYRIGGRPVVVISRRRDTVLPRPDWLTALQRRMPLLERALKPRTAVRGLRLYVQRVLDLVAGRVPLAEVLYVSDVAAFARGFPAMTVTLAKRHRALGLLASTARVGAPQATGTPVPSHYWYQPPEGSPAATDALYCEFLLMAM
jgi:GNAT superfamily N-acetyltransferase